MKHFGGFYSLHHEGTVSLKLVSSLHDSCKQNNLLPQMGDELKETLTHVIKCHCPIFKCTATDLPQAVKQCHKPENNKMKKHQELCSCPGRPRSRHLPSVELKVAIINQHIAFSFAFNWPVQIWWNKYNQTNMILPDDTGNTFQQNSRIIRSKSEQIRVDAVKVMHVETGLQNVSQSEYF